MPTGKPQSTIYGPLPTHSLQMANKAYVDAAIAGNQTFARVVKKIDQTVNNSSTLVNDDELVVALEANKNYAYYLMLFFSSPATPQIKKLFSVPAGALGLRLNGAWTPNSAISTRDVITSSAIATNGSIQAIVETGRIIMAGTAGNLQLRWAQQTANASDTKMLECSTLVVWEELA